MKKILLATTLGILLLLCWSPWMTAELVITKVTDNFQDMNSKCSDCETITGIKALQKVPFGYLIEYSSVGGISAAKSTNKVFVSFLGATYNIQNTTIPPRQDETIYPKEAYSCNKDNDCAVFTCGCGISLRKDYKGPPAPPQSVCAVICNIEPKCINNRCVGVPTNRR